MSFKPGAVLLLGFFYLLMMDGCAAFPSGNRYDQADRLAAAAGFQKSFLTTAPFVLTSYERFRKAGDSISIYIEGDGNAWRSRAKISDDPTPQNPLVLELATLDSAFNVAYLARPGQYAESRVPQCDEDYWSGKRFSEEVIKAMNEAVNILCRRTGAKNVYLIGYSGGAAIAVLIAARRGDIAGLRTIAGNLHPEAVNRYHHVSPLNHSLNPMDVAGGLRNLPQRHFTGSQDDVVPSSVAESFLLRAGFPDFRAMTVVENATHSRGWSERWKELLDLSLH